MKKFLLFAAVAATMLNVNAQYKVEKLWGIEDVPTAADCRQGVGLNGKFYINDKTVVAANEETGEAAVEPKVLVYGENGLANEQFPGGPNCGINIDQAGHLIVSLATFPNAGSWLFDDETPMIRVINPENGDVTDLPLGGGAPNGGRLDVLGRAYGDLLGEGELYLPLLPANGALNRYFYEGGEVLGEDCYAPQLSPAPNADNMTIINAVVDADGNDAIFYYQRGGNPYLFYWNGDNLEGEAINIPNLVEDGGVMRCNQNGADFFAFNGKNFVVYPCGGANNAYFDGFAIYEIGADAPLFVKEPTIAAAANGFQANWLNAEVTEDGVLIYQYAPGKSMEVYKMSLEGEEENNVYILGEVNGNSWDPSVGVPMTYENGIYTAEIAIEGDNGYFSFTKKLAENSGDWDAIAPYRFTAVSEGDFIMTDELYGQPITLEEDGVNYNNAIMLPNGNYKLEINLEARGRTLVITKIDPTAVTDIAIENADNTWYNIQGMKLNGVPTAAGIYINGGKKVVIK
ncbi:MAG: hypothetical protein J6S96_09890 [Muribaculaceae bacterium]|nr:hypothetical protein [Muribaculaceae bacterium]